MKLPIHLAAALVAITSAQAATTVFSWESSLEGWDGAAISTSTTAATHGTQSLGVSVPMADMWYAIGATGNLDGPARQAVFNGATTLTLDVHYPNPGYTDWFAAPSVALVIQGDGVGWTELGDREITVDAAAQTFSWTIDPAHAAALSTGTWAQIALLFKYGNGGSTGTEAVFHVDNLTSDAVPEPSTAIALLGGALLVLRRRR